MTINTDDLDAFLSEKRDSREFKRAIAVKMAVKGYPYAEIGELLAVYPSFVSEWKQAYLEQGCAGLALKYQGSLSFLSQAERQAVLAWIQTQVEWTVEGLKRYVEDTYHIVFQSRQSYYDLLAAAQITRKKAQRTNPKRDEAVVEAKKKAINQQLDQQDEAIQAGRLIVLYLDECHLLWDDARGYVWGKSTDRVEIPMTNFRQRQTYYGAIEHLQGETTVQAYPAGDGVSTVAFLHLLRQKYAGKRLLLIWDGATYHKGTEMLDYLTTLNHGLDASAWWVTCLLFAPNAPEQNPIEDIWLKGKQSIRKNWRLCARFSAVKALFLEAIQNRFFDFPKLHMYT